MVSSAPHIYLFRMSFPPSLLNTVAFDIDYIDASRHRSNDVNLLNEPTWGVPNEQADLLKVPGFATIR